MEWIIIGVIAVICVVWYLWDTVALALAIRDAKKAEALQYREESA